MTVDKFTFESKGKTYSVPLFKDLPIGAIRKARKSLDEADQVFTIIEEVLGEDSKELKALDALTTIEFGEFISNWTQGAPMGEASSSEN